MGRPEEAASLLNKGKQLEQCAEEMGVSISTTIDYLLRAVGHGLIRRSDVLFAIDAGTRDHIETCIGKLGSTSEDKLTHAINASGKRIDRDLLRAYLMLRDSRVALGDMYELIRRIEVTLHKFVKAVMISEFSKNWWRQGVPDEIRAECAKMHELDTEPAEEPYRYTTLIQLDEILRCRWGIFRQRLPGQVAADRKRLSSNLVKLNRIRNRVMHPVRGGALSEADFLFVREFAARLELEKWEEAFRHIDINNIEP